MEIQNNLICTGCKIKLKLPPNFGAGKTFNCPKCSTLLTSPSLSVQPTSSSKSENNLICSGCNAKLKLPASFGAGKNFNCPKCATLLTSPSVSLQPTSSSKIENNVSCNGCSAKIKLRASFGVGKNFNCPKCSTLLTLPAQNISNNDQLVPAKNLCFICKRGFAFVPYCKSCLICLEDECRFIDDCCKKKDEELASDFDNGFYMWLYKSILQQIESINDGFEIEKVYRYEAEMIIHDMKIKKLITLYDIAKEDYLLAKEKEQNIKSKQAGHGDHLFTDQVENLTVQAVRLGFQAANRLEYIRILSIMSDRGTKSIDAKSEINKAKKEKYDFESEAKKEENNFRYKTPVDYVFEREERLIKLKKMFEELFIDLQNNPLNW